jgi:hypothetical protein
MCVASKCVFVVRSILSNSTAQRNTPLADWYRLATSGDNSGQVSSSSLIARWHGGITPGRKLHVVLSEPTFHVLHCLSYPLECYIQNFFPFTPMEIQVSAPRYWSGGPTECSFTGKYLPSFHVKFLFRRLRIADGSLPFAKISSE